MRLLLWQNVASVSTSEAWARATDEVLAGLQVDPARGLAQREVLSRRRQYGRNLLQASKRRHVLSILVDQFKSIVIVLLVAAGLLALAFGDLAESVAIFVVILINGALGFVTEWRAIRSMEALRQFARVDCVVVRDGTPQKVPAEELVPGDIVLLEAGDLVPADLRVIEAAKLGIDESTLTGESLPAGKHTEPLTADARVLDRENMAYKGTVLTRGSGRGVVVNTGMLTEFGRIFEQVSQAESERTPLEKRLDALGSRLAWAVIVLGVLIAIGGILAGRDTTLAIEVAIALAVAAIPEGLPVVATIALARGMWRMAKRNALVTRLSAVETLGATSVILTDKTGTLTENQMAVTTLLLHDAVVELDDVQAAAAAQVDGVLKAATLCNNASVSRGPGGGFDGVGDPTEVALLIAAAERDIWHDMLVEQAPEVHEDPFDSDTKRMATIHKSDGGLFAAVKGAPEVVIANCAFVRSDAGDIPLDSAAREQWLARVDEFCSQGLRTIALAEKPVAGVADNPYSDLVLLGVAGLEDPAREGVREAIEECRDAGVTVIMVTGDHGATAINIAGDVGIVEAEQAGEKHLAGEAVAGMLDSERQDELLDARIFSRVAPDQKLRLIDLHQQAGHVVAMTGDGVNDAPALKEADIGVAMGLRGTAVAREAAEMVLQDDAFGTIVAAVEQGRAIFENIRKFVVYLLSCNISEVLVVTLATIAGAPLPLLPLQILFLNLVTDVFPALALGVGEGRSSLMRDPPRPADERLLMREQWLTISLFGAVMAIVVLGAMAIAMLVLDFDRERAVTVSFCTLALAQLWHVLNMRGAGTRFVSNEITRNPWIWAALGLCLVLILAAVYVPGLSTVMQLTHPGLNGWLLVLLASLVPVVVGPLIHIFVSQNPKVPLSTADNLT